jgi:predicted dehydrogenase
MTKNLKVGVVGAGLFGQVHLNAYAQHPAAELALVCDLSEERRQNVESKFGARTCSDYLEIARDETIEAVSVVTPDFMHREIVTAMLEAGKHVLVEKPLATNLEEARSMIATAEKAGKRLMVDFQNRWNPPLAAAKDHIASGAFGVPVMASARLANTLSVPREMLVWAGQSGPHWFLFPHIIDLVCWLFERQARRVTAHGSKGVLAAQGIDTYDAIQTLVEFDDCSATFETSWIIPDSFPNVVDFNMTLFGTKSRVGVPRSAALDIAVEDKYSWPGLAAFQDVNGRIEGWQLSPIFHWVDALIEDRAPLCTPSEAFHNTAIICAILESIEQGKTVDVEPL